jgi:hypothetical protein
MTVETEMTDDDCVKITVTEEGFTEVGWVSSFHLVDQKTNQLRDCIRQKALKALLT